VGQDERPGEVGEKSQSRWGEKSEVVDRIIEELQKRKYARKVTQKREKTELRNGRGLNQRKLAKNPVERKREKTPIKLEPQSSKER